MPELSVRHRAAQRPIEGKTRSCDPQCRCHPVTTLSCLVLFLPPTPKLSCHPVPTLFLYLVTDPYHYQTQPRRSRTCLHSALLWQSQEMITSNILPRIHDTKQSRLTQSMQGSLQWSTYSVLHFNQPVSQPVIYFDTRPHWLGKQLQLSRAKNTYLSLQYRVGVMQPDYLQQVPLLEYSRKD